LGPTLCHVKKRLAFVGSFFIFEEIVEGKAVVYTGRHTDFSAFGHR
jgi:hypothetical protein